ncbi:877_t:CDS:2, partial [Entrophospora sp. SA101]
MGILLSIYDLFKPSPVTPILSPVTLSNFSSSTPGLTSDSFQSFPPDCIPDEMAINNRRLKRSIPVGDEDLSFPYYVNDISSFTGIERSLVKLNKFGYIFKSHNWNKNGDLIGVVKSMVDLIESQNNLQYLSFYEFWSPLDSLKIFNSLKSQSSTLRYLCFKDLSQLNHLLPILSFLKNLETLHLDNCCLENYDSSNSILKVLGSSKIKNLYCRDDRPNANVEKFIKPIIESSNINLKTISLDLISNSLIDVINFNCPNLTHLSLSILTTRNIQNLIYQENPQFLLLNSLINLLNSLKYLKHLHLHIDVLLSIFQSNDDFLRFSKSLPSSLLYFGIDFEITSKRLGNLLKECPASLKILSFQRALDLNDECLKVLINYAKINSNFRELRIDIDFDLPNFSKDLLEKAQNYIPIIDKALPET